MNQPVISCSAPGSLMLLGEHAVLHGRRALVCAIDQRITVSLSPISEPVLRIDSELGQYESPIDVLEDNPDFRFVLDAVRQYPPGQGIELKITSDFSSDIGFGSSAAVTVATHAALMNNPRSRTSAADDCRAGAETPPFNKFELFKRCLATVHRVQGRGSGADLAASVFGGVVAYRNRGVSPIISSSSKNDEIIGLTPQIIGLTPQSFEISPMCEEFPLTAVYSGAKMKTADVIRLVEERRALNPEYYEKIFDRMDASVGEAVRDFSDLGKHLVLNQKLMEEMGLCNDALAEITRLFGEQNIPAKISGSGLGDCAIGLGKASEIGTFSTYALNVTTKGVCVD